MGGVIAERGEFGVVLAKEDGIVNIGCTATVDQVLERYADGRLDLLAIGRRRFRILSVDEDKSYLRAEIEFFNDEEASEVPPDLRQKAIAGYRRLREIEPPDVVVEPQLDGPQLSFQLAQFISDLDKRQTVLTLRSEVERLEYLVSILPSYLAQREKVVLAKRLAPLNGHAKHVANLP
jgi:Lon protease-like protein